MLQRVTMHDGWSVRAVGGAVPDQVAGRSFPAHVPGCIHLDLMAAGVIPDPHLDQNETLVAWVADVDWRYEASITWPGPSDGAPQDPAGQAVVVDLVAFGLDTVATIELNGRQVATTKNMHRSYRFTVTDLLRVGENALAVTFAAGLPAAESAAKALGVRPHVNDHPYNSLRKMACSYGWDWGAVLITAGIWRPIEVQSWRQARLVSVRPLVEVTGSDGVLRAHLEVERAPGDSAALTVEVSVAGVHETVQLPAGTASAVVELRVPQVRVWWPHGYGEQPLYPVEVRLSSAQGRLDEWQGRVGFRTVTLDTSPDQDGTRFSISINGVDVFARGVNWIPDDSFPSRVTTGDYAARLEEAKAANINLVRVWGGGIYESSEFYDLCDELGLLVWQDFLFACAAYAEEEPLRSEVAAEAREAITRLSPHPSLIIWNGGNENVWGHADWGWREKLQDRSWGWGYYTELLPELVAELDPTRPYCPSSPFSFAAAAHPNDPRHGTMHIWDVWNEVDYTEYRRYTPRFVTEFGFQAPPTWATLTRAIHDEPLSAHSPGMLHHQKAEDGNGKLDRGLNGHLPVPEGFDDWHWATSLNQARAVSTGIEHLRSLSPQCMGAVVWQLNDNWPVTSWSAIDSDGRRKPLWYALRHSFADRLLTVQPRDGALCLVAVNDSAQPWQTSVAVSRLSFDGDVLAHAELKVDAAPRETLLITLPPALIRPDEPLRELLLAEADDVRAFWQFTEDVAADLPEPRLDATVEAIDDGYRVTVKAGSYLRDLALLADRLAPDAVVDEMLCTLLPGDRAVFKVHTAAVLTPEQLIDPLVLRSANQLSRSSVSPT